MSVTSPPRLRRGRHVPRQLAWLLAGLLVSTVPARTECRGTAPVAVASQNSTPAPVASGSTKPVRQVVACLWMVLGVGGVLLAFATGAFAPVVAILLAGIALEVCA